MRFHKAWLAALAAVCAVSLLTACGGAASTASPAASAAPAGKYVPGTYTDSSAGMGPLTATITVDENAILSVELDLSNETESIGQLAGDELTEQILAAQGTEIDGVSGATITSDGVRTAVDRCLEQAAIK